MSTVTTKKLDTCAYEFEENTAYKGIYNRYIKRIIDLILALIFFIVVLPIFLIVSMAILIETGSPIIYKAERGGYNGKTFKINKFCTMEKNADKMGGGTTALNDSRITKVGYFLRKTKLDEITQLVNIIQGKMSFVGPRPELLRYTSQYIGAEEYILKVRPGITDYSSIEFINLDEIVGGENVDEMYEKYVLQEKNQLRIKYAVTISFKTDIKLFLNTASRVIKRAVKYII